MHYLYIHEGISQPELAKIFGIAQATVSRSIHRAADQLKEIHKQQLNMEQDLRDKEAAK